MYRSTIDVSFINFHCGNASRTWGGRERRLLSSEPVPRPAPPPIRTVEAPHALVQVGTAARPPPRQSPPLAPVEPRAATPVPPFSPGVAVGVPDIEDVDASVEAGVVVGRGTAAPR